MIRTDIVSLNRKQSIRYLRDILQGILDPAVIRRITATLMRDDGIHERTQLERRWYDTYDFSIYSEDQYLIEAWYCWHYYSRKYIQAITKPNAVQQQSVRDLLSDTATIVDLGNGLGLTTGALANLFPNGKIIGTNVKPSTQYTIAERLANIYNYTMTDDLETITGPVELIFASEYFEHHTHPIDHLNDIINVLQPRYLLLANAFTADAIGHFNTYTINGEETEDRVTNRLFSQNLRKHGYNPIPTTFWNNRPALWERR
jgi:hypothetical protein